MYDYSFSHEGFEWIDTQDRDNSILIYARKAIDPDLNIVVILNLTPVPHHGYKVGVLSEGNWEEIFNSDETRFYGSGMTNPGTLKADVREWHGKAHSVMVELPPLGAVILKRIPGKK